MKLVKATGHVTYKGGTAVQLHLCCFAPETPRQYAERIGNFVTACWGTAFEDLLRLELAEWSCLIEVFEPDPKTCGLEYGEAEQRVRSGNYEPTRIESFTPEPEDTVCLPITGE